MMSLEGNTCPEFCWEKNQDSAALYHRQQLGMPKGSIGEGHDPREKPEADFMAKRSGLR